jgi:hypothetical protein
MSAYNNIHRQQLFHWIGSHIDSSASDGLTDPLRVEYVKCLRGALQNGLWVKTPRDPDCLGDGSLIKVHRPITCFTEWTLGQSLPHTKRYGRLGLGFPKKFVLGRGGQPVTYVRDSSKNDPYTGALKALARFFKDGVLEGKLGKRKWEEIHEQFDYLAHFNKRIKRPASSRPIIKRKRGAMPVKGAKPAPKAPDPFVRVFGKPLEYLEEREWRIVYSSALEEFFEAGGAPGQPNLFLPFSPGRELFTVVLPDNHTVNMALNDSYIRKKLYPADAPYVTVLSLQDIGTF